MTSLLLNFFVYECTALLSSELTSHYFECRFSKLLYAYLFSFVYSSAMIGARILFMSLGLSQMVLGYALTVCTYVFALLILRIIFKGSFLQLFLYFSIFFICVFLAETTLLVFCMIAKIPTDGEASFGMVVSIVLLTFLNSKIYQHFFSREKRSVHGAPILVFILLPFVTSVVAIFLLNMKFENPKDRFWVNIAACVIASLNIIVLISVEYVARLQSEHFELALAKSKIESEKKYYTRLDEITQKQAAVRHDIKHYVCVLQGLLKDQKYSEAQNFLSQFESSFNGITPRVYTQNRILNVLFCEKENSARQVGVGIDFQIEPNAILDSINEIDMISIFGNLLDNAIRAESEFVLPSAQTENISKTINARLFESDGHFYVWTIQNHFSTKIKKRGEIFLSTKKESGEHGIGLKNVQKLAQKYGGLFATETKTVDGINFFTAKVFLPVR